MGANLGGNKFTQQPKICIKFGFIVEFGQFGCEKLQAVSRLKVKQCFEVERAELFAPVKKPFSFKQNLTVALEHRGHIHVSSEG